MTGSDQPGFVLWFTGLSGAGKTAIADATYDQLQALGGRYERLDGDIVRQSLTRDLGFSREDRKMNLERVAFVANLLSKHGVGVLASFISPYREERAYVRDHVHNFIEVYVDTPLAVCEERDVKGMYAKARAGEIKNFTGISDPYEEPEDPDLVISGTVSPSEITTLARKAVLHLSEHNYIDAAVATAAHSPA